RCARPAGRPRRRGLHDRPHRRVLRVPRPHHGRGAGRAPCRTGAAPVAPLSTANLDGMKLEGIHHITAITGDAPGNVDFYARVLGLRLVKKTVNQDDPTVYHLFYADDKGSAGADLTFFEYPNARPGRAGRGMVHRIVFRVASADAIEFWAHRLTGENVAVEREEGRLRFTDPEALALELSVVETDDEPLVARHPEIPDELAIQ